MTRRTSAALLLGLLLLAPPRLVRAEGDADRADSAPLELRLYDVRALTRGAPLHQNDHGPYALLAWQVSDAETPLFGGVQEEAIKPLGSAADVVERVKDSVGAPGTWEREGTSISPSGERILVVRTARAEHDAIAEFLAREARRALATIVVDVAVLDRGAEGLRRAGDLAEAVSARRVRVLGFGRTTVQAGGRSVARDGTLRAVLSDADVEVAQDSQVSDPIVGIVPDGIACEAEVVAVSEGRLTVRVGGWWSAPPSLSTYRTKEGDVLELPTTDGRSFQTTLDLVEAEWSLVPLSGGLALAVRARADAPEVAAAQTAGLAVPGMPPGTPVGPLERRTLDVASLAEIVRNGQGARLAIWPSNYTPPKPPEMAEPAPLYDMNTLIDLAKDSTDPGSWGGEGVGMDLWGGRLFVRHDAARIDAVQRLLDTLRAGFSKTTRVRVSLVTLPVAALPELWTGLDDALVADGGDALLRRGGARLVDSLGLRLRDGQRLASTSGALRQYVGDFDVEIAEKAAISNPIVRDVLDGASLEVRVDPIGQGPDLSLDLRLERGTVREMRAATSMHGPVQCPVYDVLRCIGTLCLRSGTTRIAGASSAGGEVTLVLVTATRE